MTTLDLTELNKAARYRIFTNNARTSGDSGIAFGIICIIVGAICTIILDPVNIILIIIGLLMLSVGIWINKKPSLNGLLFSGIVFFYFMCLANIHYCQ